MRRARYTTDPRDREHLESIRDALLVQAAETHLLLDGVPESFSITDATFLHAAERILWETVGPLPTVP